MEKNISTLDLQNAEQQKAFDLVANTNNCLFITGKAGTGKTTFIKRIQEEINKNFLVLAPTGIAAIQSEDKRCIPSLAFLCKLLDRIPTLYFRMRTNAFSKKQIQSS